MLSRWHKEREGQGKTAFKGQGHSRDKEVNALSREFARVRKGRNFLKDAAALFAKKLKLGRRPQRSSWASNLYV